MLLRMYRKVSPLLAAFFMFTSVVFFLICLYRGEVILGLQAEHIKNKNQEVKVIIEQQDLANKISQQYEELKADRIQEKIYVDREIEKIVTVPIYSTVCFDTDGLQSVNSAITSANASTQSKATMPTTTGND